MTEKALRYNEGKPQWSHIDFDALEVMVRVLEFGAKKYSRDNWKKPMDLQQILESMMRHNIDLLQGKTIDSESGLPIIGHVFANAMFYSYHSHAYELLRSSSGENTEKKSIITKIRSIGSYFGKTFHALF